jgi:murein L,D-transpeptidase YcbB/YkuD
LASAASGERTALARAELLLSRGYAAFARDLRKLEPAARLFLVDRELAPPQPTLREVLEAAAAAPSLREHLAAVHRVNPVYDSLRKGLAAYRTRWGRLPQVPVPEGPALAPGASGERVARLRERLGLGSGDRFDSALAQAVRRFKAAHGLPAVAQADAATLRALNLGARHYETLILANVERARALPDHGGGRFLLVDSAGARLWLFERGEARETMRAVVGKPGMATPAMAGLLRFATLNPYWNMPPDLARQRARRVLKEGPRFLARERLQILSDWSDRARVIPPVQVSWPAVAAGRQHLRLRQLPGGANVMGAVKFMMPNELGIYLHDTPDKSLFARADRRLSSGCVRVEDAQRLSRWLFGGREVKPAGSAPEQRVDLPEPVPVYILHLTALPLPGGIVFQPDGYGRDAALLAQIGRRGGAQKL